MKTWQDYVKEVMVTAATTKPREVQGLVLALGLCGEAAEVYEALEVGHGQSNGHGHVRGQDILDKELGDFLWYAAALTDWAVLPIDFDLDRREDLCLESVDTMRYAGLVAERMKKHLGHSRPLDTQRLTSEVVACIQAAESLCNGRLSQVCAANIAKLRTRFKGGGFDSALSAAKADETLADSAPKR